MKQKNIIIIGPPRSGKTTLAKKIAKKLNYSYLSSDGFSTAYIKLITDMNHGVLPDLRRYDFKVPNKLCTDYLDNLQKYDDDINYVVDFNNYDEELFKKLEKTSLVIYLAYPKLTKEKLFNIIRNNDTKNDWTYVESDGSLKVHCKYFLETSKNIENYAKKNNCLFFDVSENRDKVINNIEELVYTKMKG